MNKIESKKMESLYKIAHLSGMSAATLHEPTPMVVSERVNPLDDNSSVKQSWVINDGACGFGWIKIRPANCKFAKWCKENDIGHKDNYEGGWTIWVSEFNQSYERKYKYACAFADVLQKNGIKAYGMGRLD